MAHSQNPNHAKEDSLKVKDWYTKTYSDDELGEEINNDITFGSLWSHMSQGDNVYEILGVYDSVVRERVFEKLAEIRGVEYDFIYKQWLSSDKYANGGALNSDEMDRYNELTQKMESYLEGGTKMSSKEIAEYSKLKHKRNMGSSEEYRKQMDWEKSVEGRYEYANGGGVDGHKHVLHIDGQNWFLEKIDSTHFYMSNDQNFRGVAHHIGQHKGEPYYEEVREWLKSTYAKGGGVGEIPKYILSNAKKSALRDGYDYGIWFNKNTSEFSFSRLSMSNFYDKNIEPLVAKVITVRQNGVLNVRVEKMYSIGGGVGKSIRFDKQGLMSKLKEKLEIANRAIGKWGESYQKQKDKVEEAIKSKKVTTDIFNIQGDIPKDNYAIFQNGNAYLLATELAKVIKKYKKYETKTTSTGAASGWSGTAKSTVSGFIRGTVNHRSPGGYYGHDRNYLIAIQIGGGVDSSIRKKIEEEVFPLFYILDEYNGSDGGVYLNISNGTNYDTIGLTCSKYSFNESAANDLKEIMNGNKKMAKGGGVGEYAESKFDSSVAKLREYIRKYPYIWTKNGKEYVPIEGWQFAGLILGYSTRVTEVTPTANGYMAKAEVVDAYNNVVCSGFGLVDKSESKWSGKPEYQLVGFAQTRAVSRALRNCLSWMVKAAGFNTTPAEEMYGVTPEKRGKMSGPRTFMPPMQSAKAEDTGFVFDRPEYQTVSPIEPVSAPMPKSENAEEIEETLRQMKAKAMANNIVIKSPDFMKEIDKALLGSDTDLQLSILKSSVMYMDENNIILQTPRYMSKLRKIANQEPF